MKLPYKIFNADGHHVASTAYATDAAVVVGGYAVGAQIKYNHRVVVWREGIESIRAAEDYSESAQIILERSGAHVKDYMSRLESRIAEGDRRHKAMASRPIVVELDRS